MVTIKDVAKKAGVSIATASCALNNHDNVKETTRQRVLEAASALSYTPSGFARNLKKQKTILIGAFFNDFIGPFYSELIRGIQEVTVLNHYQLIACSDYGGDQSTANRFLRERMVDAAIVMANDIPSETLVQVADKDFPIMVLDRKLNHDYIYNVLIDNEGGAQMAVRHLIQNGYKRIAYLCGNVNSYDNSKRFAGYKKVLADCGIAFDKDLVIKGDFTERGGYQGMLEYLSGNSAPEAVFAGNDEMAIGALRALHELKLRVPEDVALVGFDDIQLASYVKPPLTTIRRPMYELGTLATHILFSAIRGDPVDTSVTLSTKLIVRESSGARPGAKNAPEPAEAVPAPAASL